jgi:hypothetical protein
LFNTDALILSFSDDTLSTVCVDNSKLYDATQSKRVLSHILTGPYTPDTLVVASYNLPGVGVTIFTGPIKYSDIKLRHPVSVSLVGPLFHPCLINEKEIHLLVNAVGNTGLFPQREI